MKAYSLYPCETLTHEISSTTHNNEFLAGYYAGQGYALPDSYTKAYTFNWQKKKNSRFFSDFYTYSGWRIVSKKFRDALLSFTKSPDCYQFLDLHFDNKGLDCSEMEFKLLNILSVYPALDISRSDVRFHDTGRIRAVFKYVLKHEIVDGLDHLFILDEYRFPPIMSRQLADYLKMQKLRGLGYFEALLTEPMLGGKME